MLCDSPKGFLRWTFITVLAINCHSEVWRKPQKLIRPQTKQQRQKRSCEQLIQWHSNEFQDPISSTHENYRKKLSCQNIWYKLGFVLHEATCWRNGWAELVVVVQALSPLLQPSGSGVLCNLPWNQNQTKPNKQKESQQQKVPKQSKCNSESFNDWTL